CGHAVCKAGGELLAAIRCLPEPARLRDSLAPGSVRLKPAAGVGWRALLWAQLLPSRVRPRSLSCPLLSDSEPERRVTRRDTRCRLCSPIDKAVRRSRESPPPCMSLADCRSLRSKNPPIAGSQPEP